MMNGPMRWIAALADRLDTDRRFRQILLIACAIALALAYTAVFFPYVPTADGDYRWLFAEWKVAGGEGVYPQLFVVAKGVTVIQTVMFWAFRSYAPFTLLQSFLAFLGVYGCVWLVAEARLAPSRRFALWLVLANVPTVGVFFAAMTDSVWTFIGLVALCVGLRKIGVTRRMPPLIFVAVAALCLFASRTNALALLPALAIAPFLTGWRFPDWRGAIAVVAGFAGALTLPSLIVTTRPANPLALGMAWEIMHVAKKTGDAQVADRLSDFGDPRAALDRVKPHALNPIFWDKAPPLPVERIVAPAARDRIVAAYAAMIRTHPWAYVQSKLGMWSGVLGIRSALLPAGYGFDIDRSVTRPTGGKATLLNRKAFAAYDRLGSSVISLASRPWIILAIGIVYLFVQRRSGRAGVGSPLVFLAMAYYASFFVSTQAMEFRYFAPTYHVLLAVLVTELAIVVAQRRVRRAPIVPSRRQLILQRKGAWTDTAELSRGKGALRD